MKKVVMLVAILFGTSVMVNATTPKKQEAKQEAKKEVKHAKKVVEAKKVAVKTETKAEMAKPTMETKAKK